MASFTDHIGTSPRNLGVQIMEEDILIIEGLYKSGQLNNICLHLLEFVNRHKAEIRAMGRR